MSADSARSNLERRRAKLARMSAATTPSGRDSGTRLGVVRGEIRNAWIVDPKDGRVPYSAEGKKAFEKLHSRANGDFDGPEGRTPADRCIVGFGSTGGPPMLNVMYNNNYQIVQTRDHVVIMVEMNHDARIIRIGARTGRPRSATGWATAAATGTATRWSSKR